MGTTEPVTRRAIAPAVLLGVSFFLSVLNVAWVRGSGERFDLVPVAGDWKDQQERLARFMQWMEVGARKRGWAIRSAVVFLGAAVLLMPLPFVDTSSDQRFWAIVLVSGLAAVYAVTDSVTSRNEGRPPDEIPPPRASA
jgi:hypothetical protein